MLASAFGRRRSVNGREESRLGLEKDDDLGVQAHVLRHRDDGLEGSRAGPEGLRDAEEGADEGLEAADLRIRVLHVDEFVDGHGEVV